MIETNHISEGKQKICTVDKTNSTINYRFQLTNHLGSSSIELDYLGNIISFEEYHPFGTTSYRSGRSEVEVSLKRYKYVMKELDNETGLYYYGMRYYAPWLARWTTIDPLQTKYLQLNPYNFVDNSPINNIDDDGGEIKYNITETTENGETQYTIEISITGKIIDLSTDIFTSPETFASKIKEAGVEYLNMENIDVSSIGFLDKNGNLISNANIEFNLDFDVVESLSEINKDDHVLAIADFNNESAITEDAMGNPGVETSRPCGVTACAGGKVAYIRDIDVEWSELYFGLHEDGTRTALHELFLHMFMSEYDPDNKTTSDNKLVKSAGQGYEIEESELVIGLKKLKNNELNKFSSFYISNGVKYLQGTEGFIFTGKFKQNNQYIDMFLNKSSVINKTKEMQ